MVGIIPAVFAVSAGSVRGLPIDPLQRQGLFLTAGQSMLAVALVAALGGLASIDAAGELSRRGAYALLGLFLAQFALAWTLPPQLATIERVGLGALYLVLAAVLLVVRRRAMWVTLRDGLSGRALRRQDVQ